MSAAYICDFQRTPIGRFGGALSSVRTDDLAAIPIKALIARNEIDWTELDEVVLGCANQAGEDNRNVARMAVLLAGLPDTVSGHTVNRLCGSGMDAVATAARAICLGEAHLMIAGGVESMSRSPMVMPKAESAFSRNAEIYDTTIGWRFVNHRIASAHGVDSMPETAENVAEHFGVSREAQDTFALASQFKALKAQDSGRLSREICPVNIPQRKGDDVVVSSDEHPRETTLEKLSALRAPFRDGGSVTAGNASGINDGSAALLIASKGAMLTHGLKPLAEITGFASAGVPARIMGIGPVPATHKLCKRLGLSVDDFGLIELNEAFAAQGIAVLDELGVSRDALHVNINGGAIALGHPLGMTGARIVGSAAMELSLSDADNALCTMCVGVGQGVALTLTRC